MTDLLVCPSIFVESVGLIVDLKKLSNSQLDVYRIIIILLNLCLSIKFAVNFVFYARLTDRNCAIGGRRMTPDVSAIAMYRFRIVNTARPTPETERVCVTTDRSARKTIDSCSWSYHRRQPVPTARTIASV